MRHIIRIWCKGIQVGYLKSLSRSGIISKTENPRNARSFGTDWEAQSAVDNATMDALSKGYLLEILPMSTR